MTQRDKMSRFLTNIERACKAAGLRSVLTLEEEPRAIRISGKLVGLKSMPSSADEVGTARQNAGN